MLFRQFSLLLLLFIAGCSTTAKQNTPQDIRYLGKSDIDTVADIHFQQTEMYLKELAYKLYRRNPRQCTGGTPGIEECVKHLFTTQHFSGLTGKAAIAVIKSSLSQAFKGDRVALFVGGLHAMLHNAYGNKKEFFITDELDPQKLYNAARNIEVAVWRLSNYRDNRGKLLLLSNGEQSGIANLSFERLFGKLIATQDSIAKIVAESTKRRIKNIIQRLATAIFLPI